MSGDSSEDTDADHSPAAVVLNVYDLDSRFRFLNDALGGWEFAQARHRYRDWTTDYLESIGLKVSENLFKEEGSEEEETHVY